MGLAEDLVIFSPFILGKGKKKCHAALGLVRGGGAKRLISCRVQTLEPKLGRKTGTSPENNPAGNTIPRPPSQHKHRPGRKLVTPDHRWTLEPPALRAIDSARPGLCWQRTKKPQLYKSRVFSSSVFLSLSFFLLFFWSFSLDSVHSIMSSPSAPETFDNTSPTSPGQKRMSLRLRGLSPQLSSPSSPPIHSPSIDYTCQSLRKRTSMRLKGLSPEPLLTVGFSPPVASNNRLTSGSVPATPLLSIEGEELAESDSDDSVILVLDGVLLGHVPQDVPQDVPQGELSRRLTEVLENDIEIDIALGLASPPPLPESRLRLYVAALAMLLIVLTLATIIFIISTTTDRSSSTDREPPPLFQGREIVTLLTNATQTTVYSLLALSLPLYHIIPPLLPRTPREPVLPLQPSQIQPYALLAVLRSDFEAVGRMAAHIAKGEIWDLGFVAPTKGKSWATLSADQRSRIEDGAHHERMAQLAGNLEVAFGQAVYSFTDLYSHLVDPSTAFTNLASELQRTRSNAISLFWKELEYGDTNINDKEIGIHQRWRCETADRLGELLLLARLQIEDMRTAVNATLHPVETVVLSQWEVVVSYLTEVAMSQESRCIQVRNTIRVK